ncbi:MAG: glycosyltransferase family 2 protein [Lachnospiraceae bacterium]
MAFLTAFNIAIFVIMTVLYAYQMVYVIVALVCEKKKNHFTEEAKSYHRFACLISARNESSVIGNLIQSINNQNYPKDMLDVIVIADNCTDNTAQIARDNGAIVFERFNKELVGKGYALDYAFDQIAKTQGSVEAYDGYIILDADNVLDKNYVREMNKVFDSGYNILTSYRNSKNFGTNWITAGYSLWFLREAKYLNNPRMIMNTNCAVSGTGFLVASKVITANGGWKFHLLTEDIEFSIVNAIQGERIGYAEKAILYDEQPEKFSQSWNQRMRWAKGFYQVVAKYGTSLIKTMFTKKERFSSCYDMLMTIAPATLLSIVCVVVNVCYITYGIINPEVMPILIPTILHAITFALCNCYLLFVGMGAITLITEWNQINCPAVKKILYLFTFPLFMATYIPIAVIALFKKVEWKPITHNVVVTADELQKQN